MAFSRFEANILIRVGALVCTMMVLAWCAVETKWYASMALLAAAGVFQVLDLARFSTHSGR